MSILSDKQIRELSTRLYPMIDPFCEELVEKGQISWGPDSYGYSVRLGHRFKIFDSPLKGYGGVVDPKDNYWERCLSEYTVGQGQYATIPKNSFALGETLEVFDIPRNILCLCVGKSTYHRCGIIVACTPGEPEWRGKWTVEISNTTPVPARVYAGEGIMQVIFLQANDICERSYADRKGKYQDQKGIVMPFVRKEEG